MITPTAIKLSALGMITAMGTSLSEHSKALFDPTASTLSFEHELLWDQTKVPVGRAQGELAPLPKVWSMHDCRNNQLAWAAFKPIESEVARVVQQVGADRFGVIMGTSTAGIAATEKALAYQKEQGQKPAWYNYGQHESFGLASFLSTACQAQGPAFSISTACSSSTKVFASAMGLIQAGIMDAALVGGVDSLCQLTLNGFYSLEVLSRKVSSPLSRKRDGLNIGEGAALFLMEKGEGGIQVTGVGESSDAHHMSAPDPDGKGAEISMRMALAQAGIEADQIGYINLHGTGTKLNDAMECKAIKRIFKHGPWASSTKPLTGHCLGAAGAIEAGLCWLILNQKGEHLLLPPHPNLKSLDPDLGCERVSRVGSKLDAKGHVNLMSNSFAFGGSNASLILSKDFAS